MFVLVCIMVFHCLNPVEGLRGDSKVKGVNLGGWLVIEGWIKPSLFDGIPNGDMLVSFSFLCLIWVFKKKKKKIKNALGVCFCVSFSGPFWTDPFEDIGVRMEPRSNSSR